MLGRYVMDAIFQKELSYDKCSTLASKYPPW